MKSANTYAGYSRREALAVGLGATAVVALSKTSRAASKTLRMLLNTGFSSPQAWLWLARAKGYLASEGIELLLTPGGGAYTAAPRMATGEYDLAYGDVNALIEHSARSPSQAARGVYMMFNASPSCVLVAADGPIRHPRQLMNQRVIGHDTDVALRTFGALCRHQGIDQSGVQVNSAWAGMAGMAQEVVSGQAAGAFGYVSTFTGALVSADPKLLDRVRFLRYAEFVPDLYGSVIMASQRLLQSDPAAVTAVVKALHRGVLDMLRDPESALEAVLKANPGLPRAAERARLKATLDLEMNASLPAATRQTHVGDVDQSRLARGIDLLVHAVGLPRSPTVAEVFTSDHLPPLAQRARP